jgi:hypothetical protein
MQWVSAKIFVMIIFALSWCLANFFIGNKFGIRSGYANINGINGMNFSQASFKNVEEKNPGYQLSLLKNADRGSSKKKVFKIFGTEELVSQNLSLEEIERRINSFCSYLDLRKIL